MSASLHIGLIVKDISLLAQKLHVKNTHYISTNTDGTMWVTAIVTDINELRNDPNVLHIEEAKPIGSSRRKNVKDLY